MRLPDTFKEYLKNSSLHGAKYIVDERNTLFERIFWAICVIFAWCLSVYVMLSSLNAFWYEAISFVVETTYKDWNTNFMAVFICETNNAENVQQLKEQLLGEEENYLFEEVLNEIGYFRGEAYHTVNECNDDGTINCISSNYSYYANTLRSTCSNTVSLCTWNDRYFNCCDHFLPVKTELGLCYAFNSKHSSLPKKHKLNLVSNIRTGPGKIAMNILTVANIYVIGDEDIPSLVFPISDIMVVTPYIHLQRYISIRNVKNDPEVRRMQIDQRHCRFGDENPLDVHLIYSYNACTVQCRKDKQLKICNCTSHLMPNTNLDQHCNVTGLECLNEHYDDFNKPIAKWSTNKKGIICDCLPSCTEVEVKKVQETRTSKHTEMRGEVSSVEIGLLNLPTDRYKRTVVHGTLDLVVGGIAGLFVGASVLSFVELFYYFCIRSWNMQRDS